MEEGTVAILRGGGPTGDAGGYVLTDPTVKRVAARHNVSTALVGLRWVLQHGLSVVTSATDPRYQREDLDVYGFELSAADMAALDAV